MKNLWALRYVFVLFATVAATIACFAWVVREVPAYFCAGIVLIVAAAIINRPNVRRQEARIKASIDDALHRSYASRRVVPKLAKSSSYGYPAFTIAFESKHEMEEAATCNAAFKEEIATIFKSPSWLKGWGPFFQPFNADKAVFFTYRGHLADLRASCEGTNPSTQPSPRRS